MNIPHYTKIHNRFKLNGFHFSAEELKEIGYDGVELNSPGGVNKDEALSASRETGLPIHGVVDSIHWGVRLSSPDKAKRAEGLQGLKTALRDTSKVGGSAVLLVPGAVRDAKNENHQHLRGRTALNALLESGICLL